MQGKLVASNNLADPHFNFNENCLVLERKVEMFQWCEKETVHNKGETSERKDYTYTKEWKDHIVSHVTFVSNKYKNPNKIPLKGFSAHQ